MSDYTDNMTIDEMREEIADMMECGEGFIATHETLLEYVDDFIAKVRTEAIEDIKHWIYEAMMNNILHHEFCDGLQRAIDIADTCKERERNDERQ